MIYEKNYKPEFKFKKLFILTLPTIFEAKSPQDKRILITLDI